MLSCGSAQSRGYEKSMHDRTTVHLRLIDTDVFLASWLAVYDGHGSHEASEYLENELHVLWKKKVNNSIGNVTERTLRNTFREADTRMCSTLSSMSDPRTSRPLQTAVPQLPTGSTAAVAIIVTVKGTGATFIQTANCGDSQILLLPGGSERSRMLSEVHTCALHREDVQRIDKMGGIDGESGKIMRRMELTRCFGSPYFKKFVTPNPHCDLTQLELGVPTTIVVATKGFWNEVGVGEAVQVLKENPDDSQAASSRLCHQALQKESQHNVSVIVANIFPK